MDLKKSQLEVYKTTQMKEKIKYDYLANLFRYPTEGYAKEVNECGSFLEKNYPEAYQHFIPFMEVIKGKSFYEIEELFGKTFHIQAICYLDLGYVLFAEDYKRGAFLVQMKNEQRKVNNDCGVELADNLPNALTLVPLIEDNDFREELVVRMYIPALETMLKEFDASRIALKDKVRKKKQKVIIQEEMENKNAYQYAIQAILDVLQTDFKIEKYKNKEVKPDPLSSFLPNCGTCSEDHSKAPVAEKTT